MSSLLFALKAVSPIMLTMAIGYLLKRAGLTNESFVKMANRLVFRLFLPISLFLNVYKIESLKAIDFTYILYVLTMLIVLFLLAIPLHPLITKHNDRRGVLLQATIRSNFALIGIPLAESLFDEQGAIVASLLAAVVVPLFNILAVISLSIYHDRDQKVHVKTVLTDILKNPLIQSIALGFVVLAIRAMLKHYQVTFRLTDITPVYSVLHSLASVATPLALLMLGAQFEFDAIPSMKRELISGVLIRSVFVPLIGIGTAFVFFADQFTGAHFAVFVAAFATPVAVSSVPMAQEMNGNAVLAGQLVVWTTLFSSASIFVSSFLLRLAGIF